MFKLGGATDAKKIRNAIVAQFKKRAGLRQRRRLTSPGPDGSIEGDVYWIQLGTSGIWANFNSGTEADEHKRWRCWYGVSLSDGTQSLVADIQINLPVSPRLDIAGRALRDQAGRLYLGHRGGKGGGRGGTLRIEEFASKIRGFNRKEFKFANRNKLAFVIGAVDDRNVIPNLHRYVAECARLRIEKEDEARRGSDSANLGNVGEEREPQTPKGDADDEVNRQIRLGKIASRPGQKKFSAALREHYEGKCAISGCKTAKVLEAAHIETYEGTDNNALSNGILLRADIHALFDSLYITFSQDGGKVEVSSALDDPSYSFLRAARVACPIAGPSPSKENVRRHRQRFKKKWGINSSK
jgi:hypothetical protein